MNINLHIERLVLEGLPIGPDGVRGVQSAVEAELARLLAKGGLNHYMLSGGAVPAVRAGSMHLSGDTKAVDIGNRIARTVYGGIGGSRGV